MDLPRAWISSAAFPKISPASTAHGSPQRMMASHGSAAPSAPRNRPTGATNWEDARSFGHDRSCGGARSRAIRTSPSGDVHDHGNRRNVHGPDPAGGGVNLDRETG